ncbi:nucleotidyl transferase AbiEii/AbiGii toxin family protein [Spongiibacter sp. KMU-166]|uniref:Nucleotidyl transferase AbiEii/AbiGii toxin family protein n=1 Tax=Spongiibacter thalassae TaxID=2721624 RepID=A0ABX1GFU9_9GAMM|nr:nucleotidyl transferase AbiEii/AbiGii toxin family protein [Spongiibacter thalassae]NKI18043.1 nucleotidyl transferase AbiEii/AbiGii toxin family protein [Spongiibacter thalassae]
MSRIEETDNISEWVEAATTPDNLEFRQAVHTILQGISLQQDLRVCMVLKGGILMAIRYKSRRFTKDIDVSTSYSLADLDQDAVSRQLNDGFALATEILDYGVACAVQRLTIQPKGVKNPSYPSMSIKIGYAYQGTPKHRRLMNGQSPTVIGIDYSLNEELPNPESLKILNGDELLAYSLIDLVAEKLRSLLQQESRNRYRRQDIFDLHLVLTGIANFDDEDRGQILASLMTKARSRDIEPHMDSLDNEELRRRAEHEYHTLADDTEGELPVFSEAYEVVREFYRSLPW